MPMAIATTAIATAQAIVETSTVLIAIRHSASIVQTVMHGHGCKVTAIAPAHTTAMLLLCHTTVIAPAPAIAAGAAS